MTRIAKTRNECGLDFPNRTRPLAALALLRNLLSFLLQRIFLCALGRERLPHLSPFTRGETKAKRADISHLWMCIANGC